MFEIKGILRGIRREHIGSSITVHSVSYPMPYRICFTKIRRKWLISDFIPKNSEKSKFSQKFIDENRKWSQKIFFFISGEIQFWRNFQKRTLKLCFGTASQKVPLKIKKIVRFAIKILIWGIEISEIFSLWFKSYELYSIFQKSNFLNFF